MLIAVIGCSAGAWGATPIQAADANWKGGWFNYKYEPPPKEEPEAKAQAPTPQAQAAEPSAPLDYNTEQLWNMHPDRFQEHLDQSLKWSVKTLKPQDMERYRKLEDIARRKARAFAAVKGYLNETNRNRETDFDQDFPLNNPGRDEKTKKEKAARAELFRNRAGEYGLIYFHSVTCAACQKQTEILKWFRSEHPSWVMESVEVSQNPRMTRRFNVQSTPTLVLLRKGDSDPTNIAIGVVDAGELEQRLYRAIRIKEGAVEPQEFYLSDSERGGPFDPNALRKGD